MPINLDYFAPLTSEFCSLASSMEIKNCPPFGLFVPYVFERYKQTDNPIFYIGRDTAGWIKFNEMMRDYNNGKLFEYLKKNSEVVTVQGVNEDGTDKHSLKDNWNSGYGFWQFCQKLHLYIKTGVYHHSLLSLSSDDYSILEEMGYSNTNALEVPETIGNKLTYWEDYNRLKNSKTCMQIEMIKTLMEAYNPCVIIVFNWNFDRRILCGLENVRIDDSLVDGLFRAHHFQYNGADKMILETYHPNGLRFIKGDLEHKIHTIGNCVKEFLGA